MKYEFCSATRNWIPTAATAPWMYSRGMGYEPGLRPGPSSIVPLVCVQCGCENHVPGDQFKTHQLPSGITQEVAAAYGCGNCRQETPVSTYLFPWCAQDNFSGWRMSRPRGFPGLDVATQNWRNQFAKLGEPLPGTPGKEPSPSTSQSIDPFTPQSGNGLPTPFASQSNGTGEMDLSAVGNAASSFFSGAVNLFAGALKGAGKLLFNYPCHNCGQRSGKKVGEKVVGKYQEVQSVTENGYSRQVVMNVFVVENFIDCGDCGHQWIVTKHVSFKA